MAVCAPAAAVPPGSRGEYLLGGPVPDRVGESGGGGFRRVLVLSQVGIPAGGSRSSGLDREGRAAPATNAGLSKLEANPRETCRRSPGRRKRAGRQGSVGPFWPCQAGP